MSNRVSDANLDISFNANQLQAWLGTFQKGKQCCLMRRIACKGGCRIRAARVIGRSYWVLERFDKSDFSTQIILHRKEVCIEEPCRCSPMEFMFLVMLFTPLPPG